MKRMLALKQERATLQDEYKAIVAAAEAEADGKGRAFTPEEKAKLASHKTKIGAIDAEIVELDAVAAQIRNEPSAAVVADPAVPAVSPEATHQPARVTREGAVEKPWATGMAGLGEFALAVRMAHTGNGVDPRLFKAVGSGLNEAMGPEGGFAVPMEYAPGIEKEIFEGGQILSRVDARNITGNAITYNVQRETSRADGSRQGGVLGYWVDEGEAPDPTKNAFAKLELKLKKVACLGYTTEELDEDAAALGEELQRMFADELLFQVENKIVRGSGAGSPLGFLNAPCLVTIQKETGQPARTVKPTNLSKMWARMPARSKMNAVWFINIDVEPQLDELALPVGTAALEPRFVNYGPDGILRIKGRPVVPIEYAETVGTVGDIVLADFSKYRLIRKAAGVQQAQSLFVRFAQGENTYRAIYRVDGQPVPRSAITPFKGADTTSPFVALATRA